MKGIILAGGMGTRLYPCTKIFNKHVFPIYDKPMICYPLDTLVKAGIKNIRIVLAKNFSGPFLDFLGDGRDFEAQLSYTIQGQAGGIADALSLVEDFANGEKIVVILGDNIFEDNIRKYVNLFEKHKNGAKLFLSKVSEPERFGVPVFKNKQIITIEEKPKRPQSQFAVTGLYMYDTKVFDIIRELKPSTRGELEITDVNNVFITQGLASYEILPGFWDDAGTFDSIYRCTEFLRNKANKQKI